MCGARVRTVGAFGVVVLTMLLAGCRVVPSGPPHVKPPVLDAACRATLVASTPGSVASNAVTELSGIAASKRTESVWWGHNDSGDTARVFAFGNDGRDLGTYALAGATATDWEDMAAGPGPVVDTQYLYVADIGDNARTRTSIRVYRVPEPVVDATGPTPPPQTLNGVDALTFTYPNGAHDAESLLVDPMLGALYIVTKETTGRSEVFKAPANLAAGSTTMLAQVQTLNFGTGLAGLATGADVTTAGNVVAIRTYTKVVMFERASGATLESALFEVPCERPTATETQGEAIGFSRDGRAFVTASEGAHPALHRAEVP